MRNRVFTEMLKAVYKRIVPNGHINGNLLELENFREIVQAFLDNQGRYDRAPDVINDLLELLKNIDRCIKINTLDLELNIIKTDGNTIESAQNNINPQIPLAVQNKLLKLREKGINLHYHLNLNEYTKEQVLAWAKFLNDNKIDLKVCGESDMSFLIRNFFRSFNNMRKTKRQIEELNDIKRRSDMSRA